MSRSRCHEVDFLFKPHSSINVKKLLEDNNLLEEDILPLNKFASVMSRVHDNIGHVVEGYDEGDDFIDDSEIIQAQANANSILNVKSFSIKIVHETPPKSGLNRDGNEFLDIPKEEKSLLLYEIGVVLKSEISNQFPKVKEGKVPIKYVSLSVELMEALIKYFKSLYENRSKQYRIKPSSAVMEKWRFELLKQIHKEIFVVDDLIFLQFRKLELAFKDFWKTNYLNNEDTVDLKDAPSLP